MVKIIQNGEVIEPENIVLNEDTVNLIASVVA